MNLGSPGTVILLNGPSVAGKSSIQRCLQEQLPGPWLAMGLDTLLCGTLPQRYFTSEPPDRREVLWGEHAADERGPLFHLRIGSLGRQVVAGMHGAIAAFAHSGNNVIVDYILYDPAWLPELVERLAGARVYFVGVRLPLDVVEARERRRGTSPAGHARSHYDTVHAGAVYDLELDTAQLAPQECAARIIHYMNDVPEPAAFATLRRRGEATPAVEPRAV